MCKTGSRCIAALVLGLLLVAESATPAFALPPKVHYKDELVIVPRDKEQADPADASKAESPSPNPAVPRSYLPDDKLAPLLVHPNYYTQEMEFQWKAIERGRYVVVARHPRTKCRCLAHVVLPDGAPRIVFLKNSITYLYPSQRVIIDFGFFGDRDPKVIYRDGEGTVRSVNTKLASAAQATREFVQKFPLAGALSERGRKTTDTAKGAVVTAGEVGKTYVETVGKLIDGLPGVQPLRSIGERIPELSKQEEIRRAGERAARNAKEFIPTVR